MFEQLIRGKVMSKVYTVHAYRWGDRENHSYTVGVSSTVEGALDLAKSEETRRGGKYSCEVLEVELDNYLKGYKTILSLPN